MKKSIICTRSAIALLAVLLASQALIACGDDVGSTAVTTEAANTDADTGAVTEDQWVDHLPDDLTFNGAKVVINARYDDSDTAGAYLEVDAAEEIGEVLSDAIYTRNRAIEERLDVEISGFKGHNWQTYMEEIQRIRASVAAGDNAWQIVSGWGAYITPLALENCFYNLLDFEYLDTAQPWWNQSAVNGSQIGGGLYFLTGDISILTLLGGSWVLYANDSLCAQYDIEDIPQLVLDGKWTIDKMAEIVKDVASDLNGDSVMDENDQWGFLTPMGNPADMFYTGADIHQIVLQDGLPVYTPDESKVTALYEKIHPFFYGGTESGAMGIVDEAKTSSAFIAGNVLMTCYTLDSTRSAFRDMKDDFTVLPTPKFDEAQENYYTSAFNGVCLFGIPTDNTDPAPAAAVMEAMAAYNYSTVSDVYFEVCLQDKYARNDNSVKMLDIIKDNVYLDSEYMYREIFGGTVYTMRNLLNSKNIGVSSWFARNQKSIEKTIEKAVEQLEELTQ